MQPFTLTAKAVMELYEQLKWAVAHDPCREGDRTPLGAVPCGTDVSVRLRVQASARALVYEVRALVFEDGAWRAVELRPEGGGFSGSLGISGEPHVAFYAFELALADGASAYYLPRLDCRSTAGEVLVEGRDGEWGEDGWINAEDRWQQRPPGDTGLPEVMPGFQVTVYDAAFTTPDWLSGSVMYQVFPDRFARGEAGASEEGIAYHKRMGRPVRFHDDWNEPPEWTGKPAAERGRRSKPTLQERMAAYDPIDFFGGTLNGIREKLDYLEGLGVEVLYLNPIFEARSNHRYDTANYERIDPLLGNAEAFALLAAEAREHGISIVLDAVLSHTGFDSRYFNGAGTYDAPGARQGAESPYFSWYDFEAGDASAPYRCWWGDPTLPEVDETDASWQRYILGDIAEGGEHEPDGYASGADTGADFREGGVLGRWLDAGARGYRLDVADEIPDAVLERIRASVKSSCPDAAIIGEVWEDPTTKQSYGSSRTYALGSSLDSVMNYPLRSGLLAFALGAIDAHQLVTLFKHQQTNYPSPLYRCLMNLVSSHDVERIRSVLALGHTLKHVPRDEQLAAVEATTRNQDTRGAALQRLVAGLLYALPGVPCLYYGDERGMRGAGDPFCRATFPWDDVPRKDVGFDLTAHYRKLGQMRKDSSALRAGEASFYAPHDDVACVVRLSPAEQGGGIVVASANRSKHSRRFALDLREQTPIDRILVIDAPPLATTFQEM